MHDSLYAHADYTSRQYHYAEAWGMRQVYTPAFVYAGHEWRERPKRLSLPAGGSLQLELTEDGAGRVRYTPGEEGKAGSYIVQVAWLVGGVKSDVRRGENAGRVLEHEFLVNALRAWPLTPGDGRELMASFRRDELITPRKPLAPRQALVAWVSRKGDVAPVQATGGWWTPPPTAPAKVRSGAIGDI